MTWADALHKVFNRSVLMFTAGLVLTIHEAFTQGSDRSSLYILFAGMMGLPFVWQAQQAQRDTDDAKAKQKATSS